VQRVAKPLAVVLAVPLVFAALALTSRSESDQRWQDGLRRQFVVRRQRPDERVIARYSLASLCGDPRAARTIRPCRSYNLFSSMVRASAVTGALGAIFLAAVAAAGAACRSRRDRLLRLFKPALYATVTGLVALVLLHGLLGIAGLFLLGEVIQRWPITLVLLLAAATLAAVASMIQVALAVTRKDGPPVVGRRLDPASQPRLAAWVAEIAAAAGVAPPAHLVAGLGPELFAAEGTVTCLDGPLHGRTLCLSLPLARILSVEELRGLVAHELAHFRAGEAAATVVFLPLHAGARRSIQRLSQVPGIRSVTTLPALSILSFFMQAFEPGVSRLRSEREQDADQVAAGVAGREIFGTALVKAHAFTPAWEAVSVAMERAVVEDSQYENTSELFEQVAAGSAGPERLAGVGALSLPHPTDLHPALADRLRALGVSPREVAAAALLTRPADPAATLVQGCEAIERDLSRIEHRMAAAGYTGAHLS
jgi:Zn-dependent protease with chaperone function